MLSRRTIHSLGLEPALIRPRVVNDLFGTPSYLYSQVTVQIEPIPPKTLKSLLSIKSHDREQLDDEQPSGQSSLLVNFYVQPIHEVGHLFRSNQQFVLKTIREEHPEVELSDPVTENNCEVDALIGQDLLTGAVMSLPEFERGRPDNQCYIRLKSLSKIALMATRFGWTVQGSMSEPLIIGNFNKVQLPGH